MVSLPVSKQAPGGTCELLTRDVLLEKGLEGGQCGTYSSVTSTLVPGPRTCTWGVWPKLALPVAVPAGGSAVLGRNSGIRGWCPRCHSGLGSRSEQRQGRVWPRQGTSRVGRWPR